MKTFDKNMTRCKIEIIFKVMNFQMVNDKLKCIFVEVPKTGSTSVRSVIGNPNRPHKSISEIKFMVNKEKFESYFKFGFVRNPWDRVVSLYERNEGQVDKICK